MPEARFVPHMFSALAEINTTIYKLRSPCQSLNSRSYWYICFASCKTCHFTSLFSFVVLNTIIQTYLFSAVLWQKEWTYSPLMKAQLNPCYSYKYLSNQKDRNNSKRKKARGKKLFSRPNPFMSKGDAISCQKNSYSNKDRREMQRNCSSFPSIYDQSKAFWVPSNPGYFILWENLLWIQNKNFPSVYFLLYWLLFHFTGFGNGGNWSLLTIYMGVRWQ